MVSPSRLTPRARSLAALAVAALLAACGGGDSNSDSGSGPSSEPITFQLFGDAEEVKAYENLTAGYEQDTGREVKLVPIPDRDAHLQKLTTAFAAGEPPDVFLVNYRNFGTFAAKGSVEPVTERLDSSENLERADFYPAPLEAFESGGELQCMPQNSSSLVTYVNRDLFQEAGVDVPSSDWTMDDLRATADGLIEGGLERGALGVEPTIVRAAAFVWSAGGEIVDDYNDPSAFTLDEPRARAGLQFFLDLAPYGPRELEARAIPLEERFLAGELAMYMGSRVDVPTFRTIEDFEWDVVSFPRGEERASQLHSDAYCISKEGRTDEAWQFVEYAVGEQGASITARAGRTVPSYKAVANSPAFLDPDQPPASSQVYLDAIPTLRRLPTSADWPRLEDGVDIAVEEAFYKDLGVDGILERLAKETDAILG